MLDKELKIHADEIINFLKKSGEIDNSTEPNSQKEFLISSKIADIGIRSGFYQVGISSSHGKKYLALLSNNNLFIFQTTNFEYEFDSILNRIKVIKLSISAKKMTKCFKNIKSVYDYNKSQIHNVPSVTN